MNLYEAVIALESIKRQEISQQEVEQKAREIFDFDTLNKMAAEGIKKSFEKALT